MQMKGAVSSTGPSHYTREETNGLKFPLYPKPFRFLVNWKYGSFIFCW